MNHAATLRAEARSRRDVAARPGRWRVRARRILAERLRMAGERLGILEAFSWFASGSRHSFYDQDVFRQFLAIEHERARRTNQSLFLLLVTMNGQRSIRGRLAPLAAARIFSALWHSVREVDVIGWYRKGRAAGAVLAHGAQPATRGAAAVIRRRVVETLRERLPRRALEQVQVRVIEIGPGARARTR